MKPGNAARWTSDSMRNGTTSLYAALRAATGDVVGESFPRHRHQEFLAFLRLIVKTFRRGELHLINVQELIDAIKVYIDTYNTHAQPFVWTKKPDEVLAKAKNPKAISGTEH
jgi:hypothetical protein